MQKWKICLSLVSLCLFVGAIGCGDNDVEDNADDPDQSKENTNDPDPNNQDSNGGSDALFSIDGDFANHSALGPDGLLYVAAENSAGKTGLFVLDTDGDLVWSLTEPLSDSPMMTEDFRVNGPTLDLDRDQVIFGNRDDNRLYAFELHTWEEELRPNASGVTMIALDDDGNIYSVNDSVNNAVGSMTPDGSLRWNRQHDVNFSDYPHPALSDEHSAIYVGTRHGSLVALDLEEGDTLWELQLDPDENHIRSAPAIVDDTLYVGSAEGLHAIDLIDGEVTWTVEDPDFRANGDVVISPDGETIYIQFSTHFSGDGSGNSFYAVDTEGEVLWQTELSERDRSASAVVADDGTIYLTLDSSISAVDPESGTESWAVDLTEDYSGAPHPQGAPLLGDDGTLYVITRHRTDRTGKVIALPTDSGGISETSPWPTPGGDQQRTGRAH